MPSASTSGSSRRTLATGAPSTPSATCSSGPGRSRAPTSTSRASRTTSSRKGSCPARPPSTRRSSSFGPTPSTRSFGRRRSSRNRGCWPTRRRRSPTSRSAGSSAATAAAPARSSCASARSTRAIWLPASRRRRRPASWATSKGAVERLIKLSADFQERGKLAESLQALDEAVRFDPENTDVRTALVSGLIQAGELDRASGYATSAREFKTIAAELYARGRADEALAALERALAQQPDDNETRSQLVRSFIGRGELDRARDLADRRYRRPGTAAEPGGNRAGQRRRRAGTRPAAARAPGRRRPPRAGGPARMPHVRHETRARVRVHRRRDRRGDRGPRLARRGLGPARVRHARAGPHPGADETRRSLRRRRTRGDDVHRAGAAGGRVPAGGAAERGARDRRRPGGSRAVGAGEHRTVPAIAHRARRTRPRRRHRRPAERRVAVHEHRPGLRPQRDPGSRGDGAARRPRPRRWASPGRRRSTSPRSSAAAAAAAAARRGRTRPTRSRSTSATRWATWAARRRRPVRLATGPRSSSGCSRTSARKPRARGRPIRRGSNTASA